MQLSKSKNIANTIALFLVLTIAATMVALPTVNAHYPPWTIPTWSYVAVTNNPIGVNQEVVIVFWTSAVPPTASGAYGDRWSWTVEITKPDSSKETLGPFTSDPIGGGWTSYTPTQVGTYTIVTKKAERVITGLPSATGTPITNAAVNDTFSASASDPLTLTVQEEAIQPWAEAPLPTEFWTRPLNNANRDWDVLAGDWLSGAAQNVGPTTNFGYGTGPESAHVMWTRPIWAGGTMDARYGDVGYQTEHYEGLMFNPPIILNGKLYYNIRSLPREGWYSVDLYTGKTVYFFNTTGPVTGVSQSGSGSISQQSLAFGQIYNYESPNQHGGMPYLWSTSAPTANTWMMYDAFTGNYMCSIANVSAGFGSTAVYGKDGSILYYSIVGTGANKRLTVWNTTQAIWWRGTQQQFQNKDYTAFTSNNYWLWRPGLNVTYDGSHGFSLNASIPNVQGSILAVREDQYVIGGISGKNNGTYILQGNLWALNLKPDSNGVITPTLLWNITYTPPQTTYNDAAVTGSSLSFGLMSGPTLDPEDGVFVFYEGISRRRWGYSLATGQQLWGPTEPEPQFNYYGTSTNIYQGMLLSAGWGGQLIAYDIKTGKVLWNYTATDIGFESPYGNYPLSITCIADGKIYLYSSEHSPTQPLWRGPNLRCINASNGVELWKILYFGGSLFAGNTAAIADGYLLALNFFDNQIYCFGKGPSSTTVSVQNDVITNGNSVLIKGMIADVSPGTEEYVLRARFPNGIPAVSDASNSAWMEYLYMQQPMPANATGVEVTLDTLDPNGNFVHIGTATSDTSGLYSYLWKPEVPGKYTVIASFAGSKAYYGSYAETAVGVEEAPPTTAPPEYPQPIDNTLTIIYATIAIIIAIAIAAIWIRRK